MTEFFSESMFFGAVISLLAYALGTAIQKKWKYAIFNPMLIAIVVIILVLTVMGIDYDVYNKGAEYITYFLTPATVCFAIPLYEQYERLKKNWRAILAGTVAGVLSSMLSIFLLSMLFCLAHEQYVSLLPKSITTAIGIALSGELGGIPTLTVAAIMVTGIFGNICARSLCRLFPHQGACGRRTGDRRGGTRHRHGARPRNRGGRGRDQQPFHRGLRPFNRAGSVCFRGIVLKGPGRTLSGGGESGSKILGFRHPGECQKSSES